MKLFFIVCMFCAISFIEGVPNNFEIWLQPRGLGDLPFISWFYGSSNEDIDEETAPNLPHQQIDESDQDYLKIGKNKIANYSVEPNNVYKAGLNHSPGSIGTVLKELDQEINDPNKWKSESINYGKTRVIPLDKAGPNDNPEPIENLLENLKQEMDEKGQEEKNNIMTLLSDLNQTMKETTTNLAKVFINKAWHVVDIGTLGTTRRTRNTDQVTSLLAPFYALVGLLSQLFGGLQVGGSNLLLGNAHGGNNAQVGGLFELLFPSYSSNSQNGINQKIIGGIAGLSGERHDPSQNLLIICIDDKNREKANRLFHGKTPDDILLKIKQYLEKDSLSRDQQFFIILRLKELFDHSSDKNDVTALTIIKLIIIISEDPRFQDLFIILKSKKDPKVKHLWELFKHKSKLNEKYLTIIRNLPHEKKVKIKAHPSRDCFIIGPDDQIIEKSKIGDGSDSDDEKSHSKQKDSTIETYVMKISARDPKLKNDYYICCLDDDDESKANLLLDGKTNGEIIDIIRKKLETDDLSIEYRWYIILKLYNMVKDIEKGDKKDDDGKDDKEIKDIDVNEKKIKKEEKEKIIKLIILIGENPKFEPFIKAIKLKDDPRFNEIWKLLKNEPRDTKENNPPENNNINQKSVPKNLSDVVITPPKIEKDDKDPEKDNGIVTHDETTPPVPPQITQKISEMSLPDLLKMDVTSWNNEFDPILKNIESKIKDPGLDLDSRWNIIHFLDEWYLGKFTGDPKVKSKADGLLDLVKKDPKYNETFDIIKQDNTPDVTKRVFDLFGREYKDPSINYFSQTRYDRFPLHFGDSGAAQGTKSPWNTHTSTTFDPYGTSTYHWSSNFNLPKVDYEYAKLPLTDKIDTLILLYTLAYLPHANVDLSSELTREEMARKVKDKVNDNRKDFDNFEDVFIPQILGDNEFFVRMLSEFKDYLLRTEPSSDGMVYSNWQEKKKMQEFIDKQVESGILPKTNFLHHTSIYD